MLVCDVCSKSLNQGEGYTLTTYQVVTSGNYWLFHLGRITDTAGILFRPGTPDEFPMLQAWAEQVREVVQAQCGQSSGWLVCDECISLFPRVDCDQAKKYAQQWYAGGAAENWTPPEGGPVDPTEALRVASAVALSALKRDHAFRALLKRRSKKKWWELWK
jgi:hypothetical protein